MSQATAVIHCNLFSTEIYRVATLAQLVENAGVLRTCRPEEPVHKP